MNDYAVSVCFTRSGEECTSAVIHHQDEMNLSFAEKTETQRIMKTQLRNTEIQTVKAIAAGPNHIKVV